MKKYLLLTLLFLLIGCSIKYRYYKQVNERGPIPQSKYLIYNYPEMGKEITPIFEEWIKECQDNKLDPNLDNVGFICFTDTLFYEYAGLQIDNKGILIQEVFRNSPYLKIIVYHELGHGAFNLPHDTINASIMSPFFNDLAGKIYSTNWEIYKTQYWENVNNFISHTHQAK